MGAEGSRPTQEPAHPQQAVSGLQDHSKRPVQESSSSHAKEKRRNSAPVPLSNVRFGSKADTRCANIGGKRTRAGATLSTDEYVPAVDVAVSNSVALLAPHKLDSLEVAWQAFSAHRGRVDQLIVEVGKQGAPR